jgi:hypothetical protein
VSARLSAKLRAVHSERRAKLRHCYLGRVRVLMDLLGRYPTGPELRAIGLYAGRGNLFASWVEIRQAVGSRHVRTRGHRVHGDPLAAAEAIHEALARYPHPFRTGPVTRRRTPAPEVTAVPVPAPAPEAVVAMAPAQAWEMMPTGWMA